jgi:hypothetical protein
MDDRKVRIDREKVSTVPTNPKEPTDPKEGGES